MAMICQTEVGTTAQRTVGALLRLDHLNQQIAALDAAYRRGLAARCVSARTMDALEILHERRARLILAFVGGCARCSELRS